MAGKIKRRRVIFYPYKIGSQSCDDIVRVLQDKIENKTFRVFPDRRFASRSNDIIINWGNSTAPRWDMRNILNKPEAVAVAVNKLATLRALEDAEVSHVPFTTDLEYANVHFGDVVCRKILTGHSGEGIEIVKDDAPNKRILPSAPLYTQFIPKSVEYRVHVFGGQVIDYTKKIKRVDGEVKSRIKDDRVRSHTLGWEFIRDVAPRESVKQLAIDAVKALGLDFGSVDIIRSNKVNYVLEVGTACGLSPHGVDCYVGAILSYLQEVRART